MIKSNLNKGVSIIESLVCLVIIGIGFIAVMQLSAYSIGSMDRSIEKNKLNFLSEMVMEDMIADPGNVSNYGNFNESCNYRQVSGSNLHSKKKNKWRNKLHEKNYIRIDGKDRKPYCFTKDSKKTFIDTRDDKTYGRVNFLTGKGKRKKYLGVVIK